jgi:hypothetical protein
MSAREKSKRGKSARRRGHDWERELVNILCDHGFDAVRVTSEGKFGNIGDVLVHDMNLLVQCKAGKKPNLRTALNQAEEACGQRNAGWTPVGATKETTGTGDKAVRRVSLDLRTFIELLVHAKCGGALAVVVEDDTGLSGDPTEPCLL